MWGRAAARHRGSHSVRGEAQTHKYCVVKTRSQLRLTHGGALAQRRSAHVVALDDLRAVRTGKDGVVERGRDHLGAFEERGERRLEEPRGESD